MIRSYERQASFKYLTGRGGPVSVAVGTVFSLLGIAVGVAALIIASAFLNGQRDGLLDAIQGRSPHVIITAQKPLSHRSQCCEPETDPSQPGTGRGRALHAGRSAAQRASSPTIRSIARDAGAGRASATCSFEVSGQAMVVLPVLWCRERDVPARAVRAGAEACSVWAAIRRRTPPQIRPTWRGTRSRWGSRSRCQPASRAPGESGAVGGDAGSGLTRRHHHHHRLDAATSRRAGQYHLRRFRRAERDLSGAGGGAHVPWALRKAVITACNCILTDANDAEAVAEQVEAVLSGDPRPLDRPHLARPESGLCRHAGHPARGADVRAGADCGGGSV